MTGWRRSGGKQGGPRWRERKRKREIVPYQSYVTRLLCRYLSLNYTSDIVQSVWTTSDMMDPSGYEFKLLGYCLL